MPSLTNSLPPVPHTEVARWELASPRDVRGLRASLHEAITGRPFPPDATLEEIPEQMVLVASELATNAIKHGLPPSLVRLLRAGGFLILDVADHDLSTPPEYAVGREPGEGGLGLHLARKLAFDIGWYLNDEEKTKHVWAQFGV
ncbi:ATP-binding protein [Cryptosporangium phraense]|uniref:ATP-binding protein n=1 Tax=Cryptosporangium phraense TaxID=2593070 RepID=A0A545AY37_9ACTN|nr:ATP-binding protein [Cryptosporangium phraense]